MNYLVDVPLILVVNGRCAYVENVYSMISNVGNNHEYTCWLAKLEWTLMGYIWETDNLVKNFTFLGGLFRPKQTVHALQGVSLYQEEGETLGIVGESGCGKSTFGYTLMGGTSSHQVLFI